MATSPRPKPCCSEESSHEPPLLRRVSRGIVRFGGQRYGSDDLHALDGDHVVIEGIPGTSDRVIVRPYGSAVDCIAHRLRFHPYPMETPMTNTVPDGITAASLASYIAYELQEQFPGHAFACEANYFAETLELEARDDGVWHAPAGLRASAQPTRETDHA